jgi:Acyl-CoA dehydrogenase, middle domain
MARDRSTALSVAPAARTLKPGARRRERSGRSGGGPGLAGQAQHPLGDDVPLDFLGARIRFADHISLSTDPSSPGAPAPPPPPPPPPDPTPAPPASLTPPAADWVIFSAYRRCTSDRTYRSASICRTSGSSCTPSSRAVAAAWAKDPPGCCGVLNGQKVWTSGARHAALGELIARTDPAQARHRGLTAFLVPMDAPGVEIRPIRQMSGGSSFNEVFFTDVVVPDEARLGEVGQGWQVALTTLGFERAHSGAGAVTAAPPGAQRQRRQVAARPRLRRPARPGACPRRWRRGQ